ncbi:TonB-dependent receptor [Porphyrobacter sp. CACIAM 03H1]|uniref:TonB-dependent receptor n=1 Tax=Porphyrobacter sp. CACIAM 03H1 TaxID=2003315 RepID=UPI000B5A56B3|nr:TonB-dependent receptor [Porphyrobacter sp. CACIAM 03H1]ASJ91861.1 TonB-dependent receptor [Porphyrobacter sp. CACIAM 03H1]
MRSTFTGTAGAYRFTLLAGAASFALAMPGVALAQDGEPEVEAPESSNVIIVTASKREQTLQETPISVSVTSGEVLEQAQIRDVLDLQTVTPSLRVSQLQSASATTFIIRGFGNGDNNFGIEPSVGVFIDGVFRSRSAAALSDLNMVQRIEVLNGPQSTLFGKNASAGVISVVTKEPQYEFGGLVEASYGNYNAFVLRGEVTGPISENIAFALDGSYNRRDGYATIVNLDEELSDRNRWSARGQLLIEPTPDFKIRAIADYSAIDEVCCQVSTLVAGPTAGAIRAVGGALDTDFFSYNTFLSQVPRNTVDNYGGSIQADWNVGNLTFTSITAYRELKNFLDQDVDFTSANVVTEVRDQKVDTFTQELRLASDFDGPINFLLGGFYFDESITQDSRLTTGADARRFFSLLTGNPTVFNGVEAALGLPQGAIFSAGPLTAEQFAMDNKAWSVFGTVDFEPVDGLVFTAGFNYTDDRKDFALSQQAFDELSSTNLVDAFITLASGGAVRNRAQFQALPAANQQALLAVATNPATNPFLGLTPFQFQPPFLNVPNSVEPGRTQDDQFTYLLRAAYQVSNEVNIYASYATGFKASSINLSRDSRPVFGDFIPGPGRSTFAAPASPVTNAGLAVPNLTTGSRFAGPEEAEVYELGMKAQWPGFGFNLALFDQTIQGFQSFLFTGTGFQLNNAGQQSVRGFEFDATVRPSDSLVFTFAATHLDPNFDSFTASPVGDLTGFRPGGIPSWSLATSATHTLEFGSSGNKLISRIDYAHESNVAINNGLPTFNGPVNARRDPRIFQRETNLVNASMIFQMENGLEVGLWARNLLDDQFIITVFDGVAQAGTVSGYPNQPRTYGGLVRFRF